MTRPKRTTKAVPAKTDRPKRNATKKTEEVPASPSKRSTPKKKSTTPKKKISKSSRETKPTYRRMVIEALKDLGGRSFHSSIAISKYILANYPVPELTFKRYVRLAIHAAMDDGLLNQNRASYKLSSKGSDSIKSPRRSKSTRSSTRSKSPSRSSSKRKTSSEEPETKKRTTRNSSKTAETAESPKKKSRSTVSPSRSSTSESPRTKKKSTSTDSPKSPKKKSTSATSSPRSKSKSSRSSASSESPASSAPVKPVGLESDFIWQYEDGGWKNYEVGASNTVEDVYQKYLSNRGDTDVRAVKSGQWEYLVDFMAMKQTNIQHDNHTIRRIQRIPVSSG